MAFLLSPLTKILLRKAADATGKEPVIDKTMQKAVDVFESDFITPAKARKMGRPYGLEQVGDLVVPPQHELRFNPDKLRRLDTPLAELIAARALAKAEHGEIPSSATRNIPEGVDPTGEVTSSVHLLRPDVTGPPTGKQVKGLKRLSTLDAELKTLIDMPEGTTPGNISTGYAPQHELFFDTKRKIAPLFAERMHEAYDTTRSLFPAAGKKGVPGGGEQAASPLHYPNIQNLLLNRMFREQGVDIEPQEFISKYGWINDPALVDLVGRELGKFASGNREGSGILGVLGDRLDKQTGRLYKGGDLHNLNEQAKDLGPGYMNYNRDNALTVEALNIMTRGIQQGGGRGRSDLKLPPEVEDLIRYSGDVKEHARQAGVKTPEPVSSQLALGDKPTVDPRHPVPGLTSQPYRRTAEKSKDTRGPIKLLRDRQSREVEHTSPITVAGTRTGVSPPETGNYLPMGPATSDLQKGPTDLNPRLQTYDQPLPGVRGVDPEFQTFTTPTAVRGELGRTNLAIDALVRRASGKRPPTDDKGRPQHIESPDRWPSEEVLAMAKRNYDIKRGKRPPRSISATDKLTPINRVIKERLGEETPGIASSYGRPAEFLRGKELIDVLDDMNVSGKDLDIIRSVQKIDEEISNIAGIIARATGAEGSPYVRGGRGAPEMRKVRDALDELKKLREAALKELDPKIRFAIEDALGSIDDLLMRKPTLEFTGGGDPLASVEARGGIGEDALMTLREHFGQGALGDPRRAGPKLQEEF